MSSTVDGLAGELLGGLEAQASVGAVAVVIPQPVAHGDGDVVVVVEPPPVGELPAEAGVVGLDDPVLPGAAWIDVDGLDAVGGHELLDGLGDELRAVVGADVLGLGLLADHGLEEDAGDVLLLDGGSHLGGHDALGVLVDKNAISMIRSFTEIITFGSSIAHFNGGWVVAPSNNSTGPI